PTGEYVPPLLLWTFGGALTLLDMMAPIQPHPVYPDAIESVVTLPGPLGKIGSVRKSCEVAKREAAVIGRVKDLQNLKQSEKSLLDRLPDQGSPKANWKQNSSVLRQEMGKGQPIRDASPGDTAGQFLNAERNLLKDRGWTFDPKTNYWNPPAP
ncbi:MAG: hypothetical protein R3E36_04500, partial [Nitrosomonas sp.]|nr:hypothetical protein [Nitrosomonas sp.]